MLRVDKMRTIPRKQLGAAHFGTTHTITTTLYLAVCVSLASALELATKSVCSSHVLATTCSAPAARNGSRAPAVCTGYPGSEVP